MALPDCGGEGFLHDGAAAQGWIELEGAHSACLTEEGRRLIAKEAH
jgi:hypothetical protein